MALIALYSLLVLCLLGIIITYGLYPLWQILFPGKSHPILEINSNAQQVTVIFAAYNEQDVIEEKIRSIYHSSYPNELIEVWIGSDKSTDATEEIITRLQLEFKTLHLYISSGRSGKAAIMNILAKKAGGDIFIATDANIIFDHHTITELVKYYSNVNVGAVAGNLSYEKENISSGTSKNEHFYLNIENRIKQTESNKYGFCLGMEGGLYSIRKKLWSEIPPHTFMEDFFQTVQVFDQGYDIVFNEFALGFEDVSTSLKEEFNRKIRISIGNFQNLRRFRKLAMNKPFPFGLVFLFHKILRWLTPHLFILSSLLILCTPIVLPYLMLISAVVFAQIIWVRFFPPGPFTYFCAMNLALFIGYIRFLRGVTSSVWQPTKRKQNES
jgi:cellulose synthase/poly-beta-1,6-N-acetylglucosamine synthase-like glycosyltransferase